jgi:nucleoid-associated protein YgaU
MRLLVPVAVILTVVLLLFAPAAALAAPSNHGGDRHGGCEEWYTVRCGDTLAEIARWYGTSAWELAEINDIENPNRIYAGQVLCVENGDNGGWNGNHDGGWNGGCDGGFTYVVRRGDTLGNIAWRFGVNSTYLAQVNGLWNPNRIYAGQSLWIPDNCW